MPQKDLISLKPLEHFDPENVKPTDLVQIQQWAFFGSDMIGIATMLGLSATRFAELCVNNPLVEQAIQYGRTRSLMLSQQTIVEAAHNGDVGAARLHVERLSPIASEWKPPRPSNAPIIIPAEPLAVIDMDRIHKMFERQRALQDGTDPELLELEGK
jgi:hypothetical protein